MILVLFLSKSALTAVSADVFTATGEFVDGQTAVVGTSAAVCHGGGVLEAVDLIDGKHGGFFTLLIALPCDQSSTEGTHDPAISGRMAWQLAIFSKLRRHASL